MGVVMSIVFLFALVAVVVIAVLEKKINEKVQASSPKIASLLVLNEEIGFHWITDRFEISKHYDNKSHYNKIEPVYLMTAEIKSKIEFFSGYITKLRENRRKNEQYQEKIQEILSRSDTINYEELKLSERLYKWHEARLFAKQTLLPVIDCIFEVFMSYSSPKGQVNMSKRDSFCFDEMFTCFESVSRSYLDKETRSRLVSVERGEISDSLRYDILERDNFTCVICGASARLGARLHVDHILPVSKGGKSDPSNLRTLCERCNMGKSDKIESVAPEASNFQQSENLICERCGAKLVLRKGKYGEFYGCSKYPLCKFVKKQ